MDIFGPKKLYEIVRVLNTIKVDDLAANLQPIVICPVDLAYFGESDRRFG